MGNSGKASFDEEATCRPIDGAVVGGVVGHLIPLANFSSATRFQ